MSRMRDLAVRGSCPLVVHLNDRRRAAGSEAQPPDAYRVDERQVHAAGVIRPSELTGRNQSCPAFVGRYRTSADDQNHLSRSMPTGANRLFEG